MENADRRFITSHANLHDLPKNTTKREIPQNLGKQWERIIKAEEHGLFANGNNFAVFDPKTVPPNFISVSENRLPINLDGSRAPCSVRRGRSASQIFFEHRTNTSTSMAHGICMQTLRMCNERILNRITRKLDPEGKLIAASRYVSIGMKRNWDALGREQPIKV